MYFIIAVFIRRVFGFAGLHTMSQADGVDTEAKVVTCWATREGIPEEEDYDMALHYWTYEYDES